MDDYSALKAPDIRAFIKEHENDDVRALGLKKPPSKDWPYPFILDQIKARQKAARKMPHWLTHNDILFPSSDLVEQASSTACAHYKAQLVQGESFVDLSAGLGVDSVAFSKTFNHGHSIDIDRKTTSILGENLTALGINHVEASQSCAHDFVANMPTVDLAFIDPQRRTDTQKGFYQFETCTPNVLAFLETLKTKAKTVMVKASPMLDIEAGMRDLGTVSAVHILALNGECKELIFLLNPEHTLKIEDTPLTASTIDDNGNILTSFTFTKAEEKKSEPTYSVPQTYLYDPGPALHKAGGFGCIAQSLGAAKLHKHTHLYTSETYLPDFPGRCFEIIEKFKPKPKGLKIKQGNVAVRNFPLSAPALKAKLGIKDGGENYLFGCTLIDDNKTILYCKKYSPQNP